jgi:hypothetical protein
MAIFSVLCVLPGTQGEKTLKLSEPINQIPRGNLRALAVVEQAADL